MTFRAALRSFSQRSPSVALIRSLRRRLSWLHLLAFFVFLLVFSHFLSWALLPGEKSALFSLKPSASVALQQVRQSLSDDYSRFFPEQSVAFAIPVGGRTERSGQLRKIVENLKKHGVAPANIFIFEDFLSRANGESSPQVSSVCSSLGVRVVPSSVPRPVPEDHKTFGRYLARHYKFMLDFLFAGDTQANSEKDRRWAASGYPQPPNEGDEPAIDEATGIPMDSIQKIQFAVIIEDDLALSEDFVQYFFSMARVMRVDPSLYCVSAHQDNAYYGTSPAEISSDLLAGDFPFRRGNHFMAPGWMYSRDNYHQITRQNWLDARGIYQFSSKLKLRNGHWDRFFDSLIGEKDCLFPEIPRIIHEGADGFTVDKKAQLELYANLRLSEFPSDWNFDDLAALTRVGYLEQTRKFLRGAKRLNVLEEALDYRSDRLFFIVQATNDRDEEWNRIINGFFGLIGVGGYGGWEGYVKVRGIFNGAVFIRWLGNLVLLVGVYSDYMKEINELPFLDDGISLKPIGCYEDSGRDREFSFYLHRYSSLTVNPRRCLNSCLHLGYSHAGLQNGGECWCGNSYGKHGQARPSSECSEDCKGDGNMGMSEKAWKLAANSLFGGDPVQCGGPFRNSIYSNGRLPESGSRVLKAENFLEAPKDAVFVKGEAGESCEKACQRKSLKCSESLFPLLAHSCATLGKLLGCSVCYHEDDIERGIFSPSVRIQADGLSQCSYSKGRYFNCKAEPLEDYKRGCACKTT